MRIDGWPRSGPWWAGHALIPLALAALVLGQTSAVRRSTCETYDESIYLRTGQEIISRSRWSTWDHPVVPPGQE